MGGYRLRVHLGSHELADQRDSGHKQTGAGEFPHRLHRPDGESRERGRHRHHFIHVAQRTAGRPVRAGCDQRGDLRRTAARQRVCRVPGRHALHGDLFARDSGECRDLYGHGDHPHGRPDYGRHIRVYRFRRDRQSDGDLRLGCAGFGGLRWPVAYQSFYGCSDGVVVVGCVFAQPPSGRRGKLRCDGDGRGRRKLARRNVRVYQCGGGDPGGAGGSGLGVGKRDECREFHGQLERGCGRHELSARRGNFQLPSRWRRRFQRVSRDVRNAHRNDIGRGLRSRQWLRSGRLCDVERRRGQLGRRSYHPGFKRVCRSDQQCRIRFGQRLFQLHGGRVWFWHRGHQRLWI